MRVCCEGEEDVSLDYNWSSDFLYITTLIP